MTLPNLLIAGVEKAGTTSLFHYLGQHPDVCAPRMKELNYFFPGEPGPLTEYAKHYAHHQGQRYRLEASPSYWYGGRPVIAAIRETLGQPRVVISLREPAGRFWSAYTFLKSMGRLDKTLTVDEYISECEAVERDQAGRPVRTRHTPLSVGLYGEYLRPWAETFGAQLRVVFAEDLFAGPESVVADLCDWLGIDAGAAARLDYGARNETMHPRSYTLAKAADSAKKALNRRLWRSPTARRVLRNAYRAVNAGGSSEELEPRTRRRLEAFYANSNRRLAADLRARGYEALPAWLQVQDGFQDG